MMAASGVYPFAVLPGQLTSANQASQVVLQLNAGELRADQSSTVIVGFLVEAANGSSISPEITKVTGPNGQITPISIPNRGNSALDKAARQTHLFTRIIPLADQSQDISLNVTTLNKKTGNYIVEAFLAGDVNGDGSVDANDLTALQVSYGSHANQANYNAAADFNGDGRVGCIDRTLTTMNIGAHVVGTSTATSATASPIVPLAAASTEVSLVPQSTPTTVATTVAVATPVAATSSTLATTAYVPVSLTPSNAVPVAASSTTPVVLTPVYNSSGATGYVATSSLASSTTPGTGYTTAPPGTPLYVLTQPVGSVGTTATQASSVPIYLYGQPVVSGAASTYSGTSPAATLFGQTATTPATTNTSPVPVYLYNTPNYSPAISSSPASA